MILPDTNVLSAAMRDDRLEKSLSRMHALCSGHVLDLDPGAAEEAAAITIRSLSP